MANFTQKTGWNEGSWEDSEFPLVCETCLGPNPFVRMARTKFAKPCHVCERPFTNFRWRPGGINEARYKNTVICQNCAKVKNVCQVCLFDLQYGLPVQVRDQYLEAPAEDVPQSIVSLEYKNQQLDKQLATGAINWENRVMKPGIEQIARTTPYYARNRSKICSFFVAGTCTRGTNCPFRHEMPKEGHSNDHNYKARYYGKDDEVAERITARIAAHSKPSTPADATITTLYVGGINDDRVVEQDLRSTFYPFGEITTIDIKYPSKCAFITYTTREAAESAMETLFGSLDIKGLPLRLMWGNSRSTQPPPSTSRGGASGSGGAGYARGGGPSMSSQSSSSSSSSSYGGSSGGYGNLLPPPPGSLPPPGAGGVTLYPSMDPRLQGSKGRGESS